MRRAYPMTMRLALVENGPSFEALVDRAMHEVGRRRRVVEKFGDEMASAAGEAAGDAADFFGGGASTIARGARAVAGTIGDYVVDLWNEGASPILRAIKAAGFGTTQHGLELKLMRMLPDWIQRADEINKRVTAWQDKMDEHLTEVGARLSGAGWAGINPKKVEDLPPTWRKKLRELLVGRGAGSEPPNKLVEAVEALLDDIVGKLTKLVARSPEARKAITDVGFERAVDQIREQLEEMRRNALDAAKESEALGKMSDIGGEQFVAMADDLIQSLNDTVEAASKIAEGLVQVLKEALSEVPARAQRNTSLVPFGSGSRTFPGYRPGNVLRREYQRSAEAE